MTIELRNVSKSYHTRQGLTPILKNIDLKVGPGEHVGILGQNGAGKSTLIRVLSGSEKPTTGEVSRSMSVSWPLAFGGAFLGALTGIDNVKFVCRLYGVDPYEKIPFVEDFTELGRYLREPVKSYSSGMRARLAFATSMAVDFDCYLIDEIVAVGDDRFQRKCQTELFEKRGDRAMLLVSHSADFIRQHCQRASVLRAGELSNFGDVDEAYRFYSSHELAMQPHMAGSSDVALRPVHLPADTMTRIVQLFEAGWGHDEQQALFETMRIERAPVFDSCDLVGRLLRSGQVPAAEALSSYLTDNRPEEPLFWITLGDIKCSRRQHRPGVAAYRHALVLDPGNFWGNRNLATEYFNVGEYGLAIPFYEQAIRAAADPGQSLELSLRWLDCYFLNDKPAPRDLKPHAPPNGVVAVDHMAASLRSGAAVRVSIGGFAGRDVDTTQLTCRFHSGEEVWEGFSSSARNSLRRSAALTGECAFQFVTYVKPLAAVHEYDVEIYFGEDLLHRSAHSVRTLESLDAQDVSDHLEAARAANRLQKAEISAMLYGLSDQLGEGSDVVPFTENLIAVGLYDEAENRLERWLHDAPSDAPDRGYVIDLLCMEIARSRVPGWREHISGLMLREHALRTSASVLANEGHGYVQDNAVQQALSRYVDASQALAGGPMIHFAQGIHTARLARDWQPAEQPIGAPQLDPASEIVHLFACDAAYFRRFGAGLVESSMARRGDRRVIIHAHIVDPDEQSLELAEQLQTSFGLKITTERSPDFITDDYVLRAYLTCARFLIAPALLQEYGCPILITETDCLINWEWSDILAQVAGGDLAYMQSSLWNWVPWTKIPAGIVFYAQTTEGRRFAHHVASFIDHALTTLGAKSQDIWTVDQVALWLAHVAAPKGAKRIHLPMFSVLTLATGDKANI